MPEGNKMSNGPPPAQPDDAVDARWLFPQEQAPSPPREEGCKHNGFGDPALLSSNGPQPIPSPPFSFDVNTKTTMDELCALVAATITATAKEIAATFAAIAKDIDAHAKARCELFAAANAMATSPPIAANTTAISHPIAANATAIRTMDKLRALVTATIAATTKEVAYTVAATAKEIDAYPKANRELFAANAMATSHPIAANAMATSHPIAANTTTFSHPMVAVSKENNIPPSHGTRDGHDHATGGIVPPVKNSPGPSGVASAAVSSLSACVVTSWLGIAPSVQIPLSTTTWMSLPTAAGLSDNVATATLRIEEVCARQDAHLEAFMAGFRSFTDNLDQRQPLTSAPFASIDANVDDDKDEDILSIDDADVDFEDIVVVLAPPPQLPYTGVVVPFLGGECLLSPPNLLSASESATVPPQKMACRLKRPRRRPCRRNRPRAPNHSDEAIPTHPMMGGTSTLTTTLPATSAQATNCRSLSPTLPCPMSYVGAVVLLRRF